jgi:hypothetical protein
VIDTDKIKDDVLRMQVICLKCKESRELSDDEVQEHIGDKKLKGMDYLEKINLDAGYTCKDDTKHKYTFVEKFDDVLHERADIIEKDVVEIESVEKNVVNLDEQIKKMIEQKNSEEEKIAGIKEELISKKNLLLTMTGSDNHKLWIRKTVKV